MEQIILEKAVEFTTSCYCTDTQAHFSGFSPHRMDDTVSAKNQKNELVCQHIKYSRYDSAAFSRVNHLIRKGCCFLLKAYQLVVSPYLRPCCRFYPSCSQYALDAINHYGVIKGGWLAGCRLLKCHPWSSGGYDPVLPTKETL